MQTGNVHRTVQPHEARKTSGSGADPIVEVYKALKAGAFYPDNHPLRHDVISRAYQRLVATMNGRELSLLISRGGVSSATPGIPVENTPAARSLARDMFAREIQRISFLPDLSMMEFRDFLSLLALDPQKIAMDGGMEKILADRGIKNIITNEIDISAVFTKVAVPDSAAVEPSPESGRLRESTPQFEFQPVDEFEDMGIDELIDAMKWEGDDGRYAGLAGTLLSKLQTLKTAGRFGEVMPPVLFLLNQSSETSLRQPRRECAGAALETAAGGEMTRYLLNRVQDRSCDSREVVYLILNRLGDKAVEPAIQMLNDAGDIHSRKALATALIRIGRPAIPFLTASLNDSRWYVVRGMLSILGEIRGSECIKAVRSTICHDDERVRKEAIRCLTKIGGPEAVDILIELLSDQNPSIAKQAIFSLGILKNDKAVDPLVDVVNRRDIFLKSLTLKKEALQAIGLIGPKRALPRLMKMAGKRRWFAARRWEDLRLSVIELIGRAGDGSCVDFLRKMSKRGGPVGKACAQALNSINK